MGRITAGVNATVQADRLRFGYGVARLGLLVSAIMTALNCLFVVLFNGLYYSGFAFTCPYILVCDGLFWTGKMYTPDEYYTYWGLTSANMTDMFYLEAQESLLIMKLKQTSSLLKFSKPGISELPTERI